MAGSPLPRGFQLSDYWNMIRRRKWIPIIFGAIVMVTTAVATMRQPKQYQATTTVHIEMLAPRVMDFQEPRSDYVPRLSDYQAFYNTQFHIINSRGVKQGALRRLREKGYTDWDKSADPLEAFSRGMEVKSIKDTRLIQISFTHTNPEAAAEIANTIRDVYIEENLNRKIRAMKGADDWLSHQAAEWKDKMREAEERLVAYKRDNDLMAMEEKEGIVGRRLAQIYETYNDTRTRRIQAEAEYKSLRSLYQSGQYDALAAYFNSEIVRRLSEQYHDADREYQALSVRYLPKFPKMVELASEKEALRKKIIEELGRLIEGREAAYALLKQEEESLLDELNRAKKEAADLETRIVEARVLSNESKRNEEFFKQLDQRHAEIKLLAPLLAQNSNIEVIDNAIAPVYPVRPRPMINMVLAFLVSITLGTALVFAVEYQDKTFKTPDEVEAYLKIPLLGVFPLIADADAGSAGPPGHTYDTYVHNKPKSPVAECCRSIRTNIVLSSPERQLRTIMITSAFPQEGKSTLVVNMGITFAQDHKKVLLVDTDLRKPRLHRVLGRTLEHGLTTLLSGSDDYDTAITSTDIPNLFILPAGSIPANPAELLGSPRMDEVIEALRDRFDFIIFDSPPCVAVTDAVVLSSKTDGVVFVIKQNSTEKDVAVEARRRLQDVNANLLGYIVNLIDISRDNYGYRYYYHYYHYGDDSRAA